jgi:hypothetical protein
MFLRNVHPDYRDAVSHKMLTFITTAVRTRNRKVYSECRPVTGITLLLCVVFIVCNVPLTVCVALCAVLFESGVILCDVCIFVCCVLFQ